MPVMGKDFNYAERWSRLLLPLREREIAVLEIGSAQGRSAAIFLGLLPLARITCIDIFTNAEHERQFDSMMASFASRVEKIKSRSVPALDALAVQSRAFEVIYVDGSHARDDALMDSLLAWPLLKPDGIVIWDDYVWEMGRLPAEQRPKDAVNLFLGLHADQLTVLERGYQVIARRTPTRADPPEFSEGFKFARTPRNFLRFLAGRPLERPHHGR
jgi:predicted O-methyltransferase YrrM